MCVRKRYLQYVRQVFGVTAHGTVMVDPGEVFLDDGGSYGDSVTASTVVAASTNIVRRRGPVVRRHHSVGSGAGQIGTHLAFQLYLKTFLDSIQPTP